MKKIGVKIPPELWDRIEKRAQEESSKEGVRVTPSEIIRRAILNYLGIEVEAPPAGWGGKRKGSGKPKKNNPSV
jgi:hypothetical protein